MEIQEYVNQQISIFDNILDFISADTSKSDTEFQKLIDLIKLHNFENLY